ncbi:AAA family ATPase [Streptosporangium sp. NPDC051023]|uniref:helix-turn-helix transcriptional regulator n=1 Tax=Streptosporangium sp. NPDC051023 TaxID=3155410 RepID=UPI00344FB468
MTAFVGRRHELALLEAALEHACQGRPRIVVVDGPPGIGKSSLTRRFLDRGRFPDRFPDSGRAACPLRASGDAAESTLEYGVLTQLMPQARPVTYERGPLAAGSALLDHLGSLQDGAGAVVMVVDDAHWADAPSLAALTFALRRLRADRVLAVVVVEHPGDARLPEGLRRLLADDSTLRLKLRGLTTSEVRDLAGRRNGLRLSAVTAERLRVHTQGSPLHIGALLEEVAPEALENAHSPLPAPRSYISLVQTRLGRCGQAARDLVQAACVLGLSSTLATAVELSQVPAPLPALEEAVGAGLLEEIPGPARTIAFPHPLLRAAVYQRLGAAQRARLHAGAAVLETDRAVSLRHRGAAAAGPDEEIARELELLAAGEARAGRWNSAAGHLFAAVPLTAVTAPRERRACTAVEYQLLGGNVTQAKGLAETLESMERTPLRQYVLGRIALATGRRESAQRLLVQAWQEGRPDLGRRAAEQLAWLCLAQSQGAQTVEWARRAIALGPSPGPHDLPSPGPRDFPADGPHGLRDVLALGHGISGRFAEGLDLVAGTPGEGADGRPELLDGLVARGVLRLWTDDLDGARRDLGAAASARSGLVHLGPMATTYLAEAEYRSGRWEEALARSEQAVSLAADSGQRWLLCLAHTVAAYPLAGRGDWQAATAHADAAARWARELGEPGNVACAALARATIQHARGNHRDVVASLTPLLNAERGDGVDEPGVVRWREPLVEALVRTGALAEARALLDEYEAVAELRDRSSALASAARLRGLLAAEEGRRAEAEASFDTALIHLKRIDQPLEEARVRLEYGAFLRRGGARRLAAGHLGAAHDILDRLGAAPYLVRCRQELAACGSGTTGTPRTDPLGLTPQEYAVAGLAASGLTNRQVARDLVLSVKTVEYHLGHVFTKLGITSRVQLARRLA